MPQVKPQVFLCDCSRLAPINRHECVTHRLPLAADLGDHVLDQVLTVSLLAKVEVFGRVLLLEALLVELKLRVDGL